MGATVDFTCNVCGRDNRAAPLEQVENRECPSCAGCGSSLRMRSLMYILAVELFGRARILPDFPVDRTITGLGMSDWEGYARRLESRLGYVNTFYHAEPRLDIANVPDEALGRHRFLISSDVFEHVVPPIGLAFRNAHALLKPGGVLVFTVPFSLDATTVEHFPELHEWRVVVEDGKHVLLNRTRDGRAQRFADLVFHGGPGSTLEMRLFSRDALLRELAAAGFREIRVAAEPCVAHGIVWPEPWSVPIVARA